MYWYVGAVDGMNTCEMFKNVIFYLVVREARRRTGVNENVFVRAAAREIIKFYGTLSFLPTVTP